MPLKGKQKQMRLFEFWNGRIFMIFKCRFGELSDSHSVRYVVVMSKYAISATFKMLNLH